MCFDFAQKTKFYLTHNPSQTKFQISRIIEIAIAYDHGTLMVDLHVLLLMASCVIITTRNAENEIWQAAGCNRVGWGVWRKYKAEQDKPPLRSGIPS
jgi:hypothetical protein